MPSTRYILLFAPFLLAPQVQAGCSYYGSGTNNGNGNNGGYYIVSGPLAHLDPELIFDVPGDGVGAGTTLGTSQIRNPGDQAGLGRVYFDLKVDAAGNGAGSSSKPVTLYADSSNPLACTNCTSNVTIPLSKIGWQSFSTIGSGPAGGQFNNGRLTWLTTSPNSENAFQLEFNFQNDAVYPAGTYTGEFSIEGRPQ